MIPSKEKCPVPGVGMVKIMATGPGQLPAFLCSVGDAKYLSFPNAYITAKCTTTCAKNFLPTYVCLPWPSGSV